MSQYDGPGDTVSRETHISSESVNYTGATGDGHQRIHSGQGSPVSGCSYNCSSDENKMYKCRRCRRSNTATGGDKSTADQCSVHFADQVSLQNFQTDDIVSPTYSEDIESGGAIRMCESVYYSRQGRLESDLSDTQGSSQLSEHSYYSQDSTLDSCGYKKMVSSANHTDSLPEVESDHPLSASSQASSEGRKTKSTSALAASDNLNDDSFCKSQSVDDCVFTNKTVIIGGGARLRRLSCELASETGRISPSELECLDA